MLVGLIPFGAIAVFAIAAKWFLSEETTNNLKMGLNVCAAFTAILSSVFWVVNGKLGMIVVADPKEAAKISMLAANANLWAAWFAYGAALLFAPAYIVDSLVDQFKAKS